ncbi:GNAT family N-acetyltransferase [Cellulomonas sp. PhB150]|uniref:GNAT family N-acetyltransferase n=1 Tax=Cellulomonas sp. PhB150 TaxID=2485188 RepID=UPI0018F2DC81|nr:GNAT family N-acetyltransferase [Cellulomonas sp. PhB150]
MPHHRDLGPVGPAGVDRSRDGGRRRHARAGRLVRAVAAGIRAEEETPFLHASAANTSTIRLYRGARIRAAPVGRARRAALARLTYS